MVSEWGWIGLALRFLGVVRVWRHFMMKLLRAPQLNIETGEGDPYQQQWSDSGGQQTLWRVRVNNRNLSEPRRNVRVRIGGVEPWMMQGMPMYLQVQHRPGVASFDLTPGGYEYVDVIQQSLPNGMLLLWHTVSHLEHLIPTQPYTLTLTVSSDDSRPCARNGRIEVQNNVCRLRLLDQKGSF